MSDEDVIRHEIKQLATPKKSAKLYFGRRISKH